MSVDRRETERDRAIGKTLQQISDAKVIAIVRARNFEVAKGRIKELVSLGCRAVEVTTDSERFESLLTYAVETVGSVCAVGVGTVTTPEHLDIAARCGAVFALSPINPSDWNFISRCHERGVLAVPAAFSPQEMYRAQREGARCVKLFPAQMWSPDKLKSLKGVGDFASMNIIPSGGITAKTVRDWIGAGAFAVGMGSNLVGKDVKTPMTEHSQVNKFRNAWENSGRSSAKEVFRLRRRERGGPQSSKL